MKSRLDRYHNDNKPRENISRLLKNRHLYDDLNNKIGFEELVNFDTQTRIELTSLNNPRKNRESYHQLKDYQNLLSNTAQEQSLLAEQEAEKVFDINSILEEARRNRTDIDELEKKRKLKDEEYNILSDLNKKYLSKEKEETKKDEYEGLEDLINTITSKTLVNDIRNEEAKEKFGEDSKNEIEADLLSDLVATSVDLQVKAPEEYEKNEVNELVTKVEFSKDGDNEELPKKEIDNSFYTKSMDLSELDFEDLGEGKLSIKKIMLITLIVIVLLAIIALVAFFVLRHFGININIGK